MKKKMGISKAFAAFFVMLLVIFCLPAALAEDYPLWVGEVQVTDANKGDIVGAINALRPGAAAGEASFDPATGTLTLNDFRYTGFSHDFSDAFGLNGASVYSELDTLHITAKGENLLSGTCPAPRAYGIYTKKHLVITKDSTGTLIAEADGGKERSIAIYLLNGEMTVNGGTVKALGKTAKDVSTGIWSFNAGVTVNEGAKFYGVGGESEISRGMTVFSDLTVNGGYVNATGGKGGSISHGISAGRIVSKNANSVVYALSNQSKEESSGIRIWNETVLNNGLIEAHGGKSENNKSRGIHLEEAFTVAGGEITAEGKNGAFSALPVIGAAVKADIWYGEDKNSANASPKKPESDLAANYHQKFVRIRTALKEEEKTESVLPPTGDSVQLGALAALMLFSVAGFMLLRKKK